MKSKKKYKVLAGKRQLERDNRLQNMHPELIFRTLGFHPSQVLHLMLSNQAQVKNMRFFLSLLWSCKSKNNFEKELKKN
jgi:hypothetical protein